MRHAALAAALLSAAAAAGCGGSANPSSAGARATVQRYFAAVAARQPDAACAQLSGRSRQRLAEVAARLHASGCAGAMRAVFSSSYGRRLARFAHPRITSLSVHGDGATARVDGVDTPLTLVDEDGTWRIDFAPPSQLD